MSDNFVDQDLDTPTEADLDQAYGSKFLSAADVGNRKIRAKIEKVRKEELRGPDGAKRMKFVLHLGGVSKPLVLNSTNASALIGGLGRNPASWIGALIGLYVDHGVMYAGKRVAGLRLRVLGPISAARPTTPAMPPEPPPYDDPGIEDMSERVI
jgi:hypothetical protein